MRTALGMVLAALAASVVAAAPAAAQDKPIEVNLGFGITFPTTDIKNDFNAGWNGGIGVTFFTTPTFGVQVEYGYHRMNGPEKTISVCPTPDCLISSPQLIESNHQMHVVDFNGVWRPHHDGPLGGYVLGGGGYYHRIVQLTSPAVGYTTVCDPFWYICYPAAVAVDNILGERSENDFGIDVGGGVTFGHEAKFYVEFRYHYVFGKTITPTVQPVAGVVLPSSLTTSAAYFPITFGVRW